LCTLTSTHNVPIKAYLTGDARVKCRVAAADAPPPYDGLFAVELRWEEGDNGDEMRMHMVGEVMDSTQELLPAQDVDMVGRRASRKLVKRMPAGLFSPERELGSLGKIITRKIARVVGGLRKGKDGELDESVYHHGIEDSVYHHGHDDRPRRPIERQQHGNAERHRRHRSEASVPRYEHRKERTSYAVYVRVEHDRREGEGRMRGSEYIGYAGFGYGYVGRMRVGPFGSG
jgi:hypothetical protein